MKYFVSMLAVAVLTLGAIDAKAEGPTKGFGVGIEAGGTETINTGTINEYQLRNMGASAFYMLSPMIQIGLGMGLSIESNNNYLLLSPGARFLIDIGLAATLLTLEAQIRVILGPTNFSALIVRAGLQHWITKTLGLYGGFAVMNLGFDPSGTTFGFLTPFIGAQFMLE